MQTPMQRLLSLVFLAGLAGAANAQSPAQSHPTADTAAAAASDSRTRADDNLNDRNCLRDTGSRITAAANEKERRNGSKETHCTGSPGRSYSQDDLQRTGDTNIADALRRLDPSVR